MPSAVMGDRRSAALAQTPVPLTAIRYKYAGQEEIFEYRGRKIDVTVF